MEVRGSDRGTSVVFRGSCHGLPWNPRVSTARVTAFYCTWRFHGKCRGCDHGTCRGSVRGNLCGTNHGNPRKYHGNCHGIFHGHLHVNCRGNPRQSTVKATAFHGNCHGNPPKCHGSTRQLPRNSTAVATAISTDAKPQQFARKTTAFRGHPRQLPRQSSDTRRLKRNSTAIATANSRTPNHCNFHGIPRPSTAISLPHSAAIGGNCHGKFYLK